MIISVASGKGGTGKTTFATNLAFSLRNVQFIDCDVEEPNANVFIKADMNKSEEVKLKIPEIDKGKCTYCGKCAEFCAYNALAVVSEEVLVFPELCHSCGGCKIVCPENAIKWKKRSIGKIEYGEIKDGIEFYQGLLKVGESIAIPIIKNLKRKAKNNKDIIIDSPPGTSCPVIESIQGSDYCVLVTEATPFGLNDLKLAVKVVRHLNIPFGVVINRYNVGYGKVEQYCEEENIPVIMKIPHSKKIATLYSNGIPFVEKMPRWKQKFKNIFENIKREDLQ